MSQTFSMTGYGKETISYRGNVITIELRSLNSKQSDINVRIPSFYREKELEIREMINAKTVRGKVDLTIQRDITTGSTTNAINKSAVLDYYKQIKGIEQDLGGGGSSEVDYLSTILKLPDVMAPVQEDLEEEEVSALMKGLQACITRLLEFRTNEGSKLEKVLVESTHKIAEDLKRVEPLEKERIERIRSRVGRGLNEAISEGGSVDADRFEQELIYYLEKLDISEEKVRLQAHCDHFLQCMEEETVKGKKLSFIAQEMGREINTLGSKAQHAQIQRIVVEMKDELERIKEQVLNVL